MRGWLCDEVAERFYCPRITIIVIGIAAGFEAHHHMMLQSHFARKATEMV